MPCEYNDPNPFAPCQSVKCPCKGCDEGGVLKFTGFNVSNTLAFLECSVCRCAYISEVIPNPDLIKKSIASSGLLLTGLRLELEPQALSMHSARFTALWELPGGKVDPGESIEKAIQREWLEEVGLLVETTTHIATAFLQMEIDFHIDLFVIKRDVAHLNRPPEALDHIELRWVEPLYAIQHMPCAPAFYLHWPHLRQYMAKIENGLTK